MRTGPEIPVRPSGDVIWTVSGSFGCCCAAVSEAVKVTAARNISRKDVNDKSLRVFSRPLRRWLQVAVTLVLPLESLRVLEYLERGGRSPFSDWFRNLDAHAAAKVSTCLARLGAGNFSNVKGAGGGVFEYRIDFGPGYRVYFGKDGDALVILLGGGTKKRQERDIALAHKWWADYKKRKTET